MENTYLSKCLYLADISERKVVQLKVKSLGCRASGCSSGWRLQTTVAHFRDSQKDLAR
jgi:hypothetical protein